MDELYPLLHDFDIRYVPLGGGWFVDTASKSLYVEHPTSLRIGWVEDVDGNAYIVGTLTDSVVEEYRRFIEEHTQLNPTWEKSRG